MWRATHHASANVRKVCPAGAVFQRFPTSDASHCLMSRAILSGLWAPPGRPQRPRDPLNRHAANIACPETPRRRPASIRRRRTRRMPNADADAEAGYAAAAVAAAESCPEVSCRQSSQSRQSCRSRWSCYSRLTRRGPLRVAAGRTWTARLGNGGGDGRGNALSHPSSL
jgi:hypothetical protein